MDRTIPPFAAKLLSFIGSIEAPQGYDTVFGNNQARLPKPLTSMTLNEVIAAGPSWTKRFGSSAAGRYQFMRDTLRDLKAQLGLTGSEKLTPDLQDRLAFALLRRRGYDDFDAGRIGVTAFALRLAQEWASLPVLKACRGAHRQLVRGQSYYAGDGLNKALVAPERVEALLKGTVAPKPVPIPVRPPEAPMPANAVVLDKPQIVQPAWSSKTIIGLVLTAFGFLSTWKPGIFPAALQPILEQGLNAIFAIIGIAIAAYGRWTAQGPIGFVMGGGMSDVSKLQAEVEELRRLVAEARVELGRS